MAKPETIRDAFDRFMDWQMQEMWPEGTVMFSGRLKPVTASLEPDDPAPWEPAAVMKGLERSASALVELVTRLGWTWARHPQITIGGEVLHLIDGTTALATVGQIEMAFRFESLGAEAAPLRTGVSSRGPGR